MKKYFIVARNTWDETNAYRLNFIIWRIRMVFTVLASYFLWYALIPEGKLLFGYSQSSILTYILGASILSALIFSSRSGAMGDEIINGTLSNYLIKPINYFGYWFARDLGDKAINISFAIVELSIIFFLLRPPIYISTNILSILLMILAIFSAIIMYFFINILISIAGFWLDETWSLRFLFFVIIQFLAGMLFPLDIIPYPFSLIIQILPFQYMIYFPVKVYLGQLSVQAILIGLTVSFVWLFILYKAISFFWLKGLKSYSSVGR